MYTWIPHHENIKSSDWPNPIFFFCVLKTGLPTAVVAATRRRHISVGRRLWFLF